MFAMRQRERPHHNCIIYILSGNANMMVENAVRLSWAQCALTRCPNKAIWKDKLCHVYGTGGNKSTYIILTQPTKYLKSICSNYTYVNIPYFVSPFIHFLGHIPYNYEYIYVGNCGAYHITCEKYAASSSHTRARCKQIIPNLHKELYGACEGCSAWMKADWLRLVDRARWWKNRPIFGVCGYIYIYANLRRS